MTFLCSNSGSTAVNDDNKFVHLFPFGNGKGNHWFTAPLELPVTGQLNFSRITSDEADYNFLAGDDDQVYVRTNFGAPKYRVIRMDLKKPEPENWVEILPEHKSNVLSEAEAFDNDKLVAIYIQNVSHVIQIHNLTDGAYIRNVETPLGVNIRELSATMNGTELFYIEGSFLSPGVVVRYDFTSDQRKVSTGIRYRI